MEYICHLIAILEDGLQWRDLVPITLIIGSIGYKIGYHFGYHSKRPWG